MASQFDPPGFVDDLTAGHKAAWSKWVSDRINASRAGAPPRPQFIDNLGQPKAADEVEKDITWTAFPRRIKIHAPSDAARWKAADASRDVQDEYCEWSVERDATGKIVSVMFTSEAPEYWIFLATVDRAKVLELYQTHISASVRDKDLFTAGGKYRTRNRWNDSTSTGAMHLIQDANTLGAEIELAAAATVLRTQGGQPVTGEQELIECARYGEPERFSDPHIGAEVNAIARQGAAISLANPVGLCIAGLSTAGWKTPDGSGAPSYWKVIRGTPEKAVRAVYSVPKEKGFTVSDITINGRNIQFGSQIADFITVKLTGLAKGFGTINAAQVPCGAESAVGESLAESSQETPSVESVLAAYAVPTQRG